MDEETYSCSSKTRPSKIEKGGKGIYCCIPNCGSAFYNSQNEKTGIGFFKFPTEPKARRLWTRVVSQCRRKSAGDNFKITSYTRICEFHFKLEDIKVSLGIGRKTLRPNAIPSFKLNTHTAPLRRSPRKRLSLVPEAVAEPTLDNMDISEESEDEEEKMKTQLKTQIDLLTQENMLLKQENENLKKKLHEHIYSFENISQNEILFRSETCLDTETFNILYEFVNPGEHCENIKMYDSKLKESEINEKLISSEKKQGPKTKVDSKNQLFLFLTWLKGGHTFQHISWLFKIPISTVSRYIISWTNFLFFSLGSIPIWASRKMVDETMPESFKQTYPTTRCIIDCTELFCQRPSSLASQSHMYSQYKSHVTYKGLLGISPSGAITFISQLYEGSISDKEIVKRSGLLNKELWEKNDSIMADRGFTISDMLEPFNVKLNIPSFLDGRDQLSEDEVKESQTIASVRIHVERAIQRVKKFRQLRNEIPLTLHGSVNQLWTVACLLCNFMPPLIQKE